MSSRVIVQPAQEPVDLATTKLHCRIDQTVEDALIGAYITAARAYAEQVMNRSIITQTRELWLDAMPSYLDVIDLRNGPVQSLALFRYYDSTSLSWVVVDPSLYVLDLVSNVAQIGLTSNQQWPTALDQINSVQIQYVAGFGDAPVNVPPAIQVYIMSLVGAMYNNREAVAEKAAVKVEFLERLLDPFCEPQL